MTEQSVEDLLGPEPDQPTTQAAPDTLPEIVSAATLGELLGITANRVSVLAADGALPKAGRNQYPLRDCVQAYVTYARENPFGRKSKDGNLNDEKLRLAREQADKIALANAVTRNELVPVEDVRREWRGLALDLRARLLAIAPRVAAAVGLDRNAAASLDSEIRHALEDIADDH